MWYGITITGLPLLSLELACAHCWGWGGKRDPLRGGTLAGIHWLLPCQVGALPATSKVVPKPSIPHPLHPGVLGLL